MDETTDSNPNYSKIMSYVDANPAAVLSTVSEGGKPRGAAVYFCTASHHTVCFVTKTLTQKYKDIIANPNVSITFMNERDTSTMQASGRAFVVDDPSLLQYVIAKIEKIHGTQTDWMPPIAKIHAGNYAIIGVELDSARLAEFQNAGSSIDSTITEL